MTFDEAVAGLDFPADIRRSLVLLDLEYYDFGGVARIGHLVLHRELAEQATAIFRDIAAARFPIAAMQPVVAYGWSDDASMAANNCSAFNYRLAVGRARLSQHAHGRAIDINPLYNPYVRGELVLPPGATYDPVRPGTLTADGPVVVAFVQRGWTWGGSWESLKDWHHFEKPE